MSRPAGRAAGQIKRFSKSRGVSRIGSGGIRTLAGRVGSVSFQISRVGSGRVGSGRVGSGRVGSGRVGSGRVGLGRVGSDWVGSGQVGSGGTEISLVGSIILIRPDPREVTRHVKRAILFQSSTQAAVADRCLPFFLP